MSVVLVVILGGAVIAILGWDRYPGAGQGAGGGAQPTDEVFIDPGSGQRMRVWFDPKTGEREYPPDQPEIASGVRPRPREARGLG